MTQLLCDDESAGGAIFFSSPISLLLLLLLITEIRPARTAAGVLALSAAASCYFPI